MKLPVKCRKEEIVLKIWHSSNRELRGMTYSSRTHLAARSRFDRLEGRKLRGVSFILNRQD